MAKTSPKGAAAPATAKGAAAPLTLAPTHTPAPTGPTGESLVSAITNLSSQIGAVRDCHLAYRALGHLVHLEYGPKPEQAQSQAGSNRRGLGRLLDMVSDETDIPLREAETTLDALWESVLAEGEQS
jgi:hypothetical protein